ncbi:MAG: protein kinase, partial [Myxococcales bacterium]|nr:protein kinase [Myxococcales bacterium]
MNVAAQPHPIPASASSSTRGRAVDCEPLRSGSKIGERYEIASLIGRGGTGDVYLADDLEQGRRVAVKVLAPALCVEPRFVARFPGEARSASAIGHSGIVELLDAGVLADGRLYLVMEHLEGCSLETELAIHGPLDPLRACEIALAVASAVAAAHARGILHRDLKPG